MNEIDPIVGNWYRNLEDGTEFEVVAVDEDGETVEIQLFDGEVEELDLESWGELVLEAMEPPEDWSGPFDDLEPDDIGDSEARDRGGWEDPLEKV